MPKHLQQEIDKIRARSKQQVADELSVTTGINRETIISLCNDTQTFCQATILDFDQDSTLYDTSQELNIVALQRDYTLTEDNFFGNGDYSKVEFSYNGDSKYYVPLRPATGYEIDSFLSNDVYIYQPIGRGIIRVSPTPSTSQGKLRITFRRALDSLDVRRGTIASRTLDGTNTYYTTITLAADSILDESQFYYSLDTRAAKDPYICINDGLGNVTYYNVQYSDYDPTTHAFTLTSPGVLMTGGTIPVGSYITTGRYSTSTSKLPPSWDMARMNHTISMVLDINENAGAMKKYQQAEEMIQILAEQMVGRGGHGPLRVPVLNPYFT